MKYIFSLLLLSFSMTSFADDVSKAFGQKLRYFHENAVEPFNEIPFTPEDKDKFLLFDKYFISVTPKTNKIYAVIANGPLHSTCIKDIVIIHRLLDKKYEFEKIETDKSEIVEYEDSKGNKLSDKEFVISYALNTTNIFLTCEPQNNKISLIYSDKKLAKQSREEEQEIFLKEIDKEMQALENIDGYSIKGL